MKIPHKIAIVIFVFSFGCLSAQDFPYYYFSNFNPMVNNPAFAAAESEIRADAGIYTLWAGGYKPLNDYLVSFSISPNTKLKKQKRATGYEKKIGLGAVFLRERFGAFSQNNFQLNYAYHFPISKHAFLSFGIALSVENLYIDVNSLTPINQEDPRLLTGNNSSVLFDGGFGTALHGRNYMVSLSIMNLASDDFKFDDVPAKGINNYTKLYISGEYSIELSPNIYLKPKIVVRNSRTKKYNFDPSMAVDFNFFVVGFGFRSENSLHFFTKIPYKDFFFTYSSENPIESNHMFGNGHTFALGWSFNSPRL